MPGHRNGGHKACHGALEILVKAESAPVCVSNSSVREPSSGSNKEDLSDRQFSDYCLPVRS